MAPASPDSSAQVVFSSDGYTYLAVRPRLEYEEAGRVKGSVNIPIMNARRVWDPEQKKKVIEREANENFSEQVRQRSLAHRQLLSQTAALLLLDAVINL